MSVALQPASPSEVRNLGRTVTFRPATTFHAGWNKIAGLRVENGVLNIDRDVYFIRAEEETWSYVPWEMVQERWSEIQETADKALEQAALEFIAIHRRTTRDPAVILRNAEQVYKFLYDPDRLATFDDLRDVSSEDLRILREASILCALNKVARSGRITVIGPAWYFAQCARLVFDLDREAEIRVDELFHGGFFNGVRLSDQVRAHVALGGKLVHGCQGSGNGAGGCVVEYGTNLQTMQAELVALRDLALRSFSTSPA